MTEICLRHKLYLTLKTLLRRERTRQLNQENKLRIYDLEVTVSWNENKEPTVHCDWSSGDLVREYARDTVKKWVEEISNESIRPAVFEILKKCAENREEEKRFQRRMSGK